MQFWRENRCQTYFSLSPPFQPESSESSPSEPAPASRSRSPRSRNPESDPNPGRKLDLLSYLKQQHIAAKSAAKLAVTATKQLRDVNDGSTTTTTAAASEEEGDAAGGQEEDCPAYVESFGGVLHQLVQKCRVQQRQQCFPVFMTVFKTIKVRFPPERPLHNSRASKSGYRPIFI